MTISSVPEQRFPDRYLSVETFLPLLFAGILDTIRNRVPITTVALLTLMSNSMNATAAPGVTAQSVRNTSYHPAIWTYTDQLEVRSVRLVNGVYEKGQKNVDLDYELMQTGRAVFGDINGDGKQDAAVIMYHMKDDREASEIAIVLDVKGVPVHVASRFFGVGTEIMDVGINKASVLDSRTGKPVATSLVQVAVSNAKYCAGQGKTVSYRLVNDKLIGPDPFGKTRY
ncbi:MAG: hypothetical protein HGB22_07120 [Chlorobiaceae bacterium]|nr:hypothetical protein [Chlorobiaceae bacterium]